MQTQFSRDCGNDNVRLTNAAAKVRQRDLLQIFIDFQPHPRLHKDDAYGQAVSNCKATCDGIGWMTHLHSD